MASAATAGEGAGGATKLVTVHGTGAGHLECNGERWWQRSSPFLTELAKRLDLDPGRVEIVPFHWELGPNSETGRRTAAKALYEKLKGYDKSGADYHVIGHSHGGSVIYDALLRSVRMSRPLERLKSWSTVGTPFLDYRPNRFLFSRLGTKGLTLYATAIGALVFAAGVLIYHVFGGGGLEMTPAQSRLFFTELVLPPTLIALGYGLTCLAFLYGIERHQGGAQTIALKNKAAQIYRDRWLGLWHQDDEAISALSNVQFVKGPIIPSAFLVPFVSILPVLVTVLASVAVVIQFLPVLWDFLKESWPSIMQSANGTSTGSSLGTLVSILVPVGALALLAAIYVGITSTVVAILKVVAHGVGWPLAKAIDNLVWSSVRQQAWGDDRQGEGVAQVRSHPPEFPAMFDPLPAAVADEVSRFSEKHAILTLTKVREVLGMTRNPNRSPDMRAQLSEQLNWRELIHTTYFEIPEFTDLAAYGLHKAGLAPLKEDHWTSERRDRARGWLGAISVQKSAPPAAAKVTEAA